MKKTVLLVVFALLTMVGIAKPVDQNTARRVAETYMQAAGMRNVAALADSIMKQFEDKQIDHVEIIYNRFKNSLTQVLSTEQFLPVEPKQTGDSEKKGNTNDYIYEPSKEDIVRSMKSAMREAHLSSPYLRMMSVSCSLV